jgi:hypothetical protein
MIRQILMACALTAFCRGGDLDAIKAEPNLEKRSDRALDYADQEIDVARKAYAAGNLNGTREALKGVRASVELSYDSLQETGKNPRRNPKHFKRAEVRIREMLRRLHGLEDEFSVEDRPPIQEIEQRLQEIHDELLTGIMTKKK